MSYPGHSYSTAPADWASNIWVRIWPRRNRIFGVFLYILWHIRKWLSRLGRWTKGPVVIKKTECSRMYEIYKLYIAKETWWVIFDNTLLLFSGSFNRKISWFRRRWKYMNLVKKDKKDFTTFASILNYECENFLLSKSSSDNFKCFIFVQGLTSAKDV